MKNLSYTEEQFLKEQLKKGIYPRTGLHPVQKKAILQEKVEKGEIDLEGDLFSRGKQLNMLTEENTE